jgi:hypothetical protein
VRGSISLLPDEILSLTERIKELILKAHPAFSGRIGLWAQIARFVHWEVTNTRPAGAPDANFTKTPR